MGRGFTSLTSGAWPPLPPPPRGPPGPGRRAPPRGRAPNRPRPPDGRPGAGGRRLRDPVPLPPRLRPRSTADLRMDDRVDAGLRPPEAPPGACTPPAEGAARDPGGSSTTDAARAANRLGTRVSDRDHPTRGVAPCPRRGPPNVDRGRPATPKPVPTVRTAWPPGAARARNHARLTGRSAAGATCDPASGPPPTAEAASTAERRARPRGPGRSAPRRAPPPSGRESS